MTETNPILRAHPKLTFRRGDFTYSLVTIDGHSTYSVTDGVNKLSVPIQWGFGAGAQTWVFSLNGKYYETLVSYFPSIAGLGITLGDEIFTPRTLPEAIGRELRQQDLKSCFDCHTTGAIVNDKLDLTAFQAGVTCQHCHVGAATHIADASRNQFASTPARLRNLPSEGISNLCGQCHRSWSTVVKNFMFGEVNVRFAPYRLANSRCFSGTDPRISCLACHNPHENVSANLASYDAKCQACHSPSHLAMSHQQSGENRPAGNRVPGVCSVARENCVSCHMPKVKLADDHIEFTDHFIRIVKPGEPYPD